ncbi:MAG TPA: hypothetical protein VE604_01915 [Candidatus Polarisedimenticolia bacterium]|jgi:hypothetical protein|nr:hypothetical protein [Candidatus Polarisedimenticolia bacterium]
MKHIVQIVALLMGSILFAFAQTTPDSSKSLGDVARESRKEKKDQAKIVLSDETQQLRKPLIPDVFDGGIDNIDEIFKAISDYRSTHNLEETEAAVRNWYEKHDALLASAIEENRRIEQRERDRLLGYRDRDMQPHSQEEYQEIQHIELVSRREDLRHKQENGLLSARIQQAFIRLRPQMKSKYGMNIEWFKIRCGNGNCSY